jgi:outer membrane murein-binding lipoprotein Lpp
MSIESGWLTVAEAAQITGASERAVRRRAALPENAARTRHETRHTATGERKATVLAFELVEEIRRERGETLALNAAKGGGMVAEGGTQTEEQGATVAPEVEERGEAPAGDGENTAQGGETVAERGSNAAPVADASERLISALEREIGRLERDKEAWRSQAEEAQRNAAQATAALREYLRAQPRALTEGQATAPEVATASEIAPDGVALAESVNVAQIAVKREGRPLWKVILGIR